LRVRSLFKLALSAGCGGTHLGRRRQEDVEFQASLGKFSKTLSQKQNTDNKRAVGIVQVVEHLPGKFKAC
jgi:hypothetical protein